VTTIVMMSEVMTTSLGKSKLIKITICDIEKVSFQNLKLFSKK
jgi:hypothetical protein